MKTLPMIAVVLYGVVWSVYAEQPLKLTLTTPKSSYLTGEDIPVGISVMNVGTKTVPGLFTGRMRLKLLNEDGNELKYTGVSVDNYSPRSDSLGPSEEAFNAILINEYFGKVFSVAAYRRFLHPGKYTFRVIFSPGNSDPESTHVVFRVVEPDGEERVVYDTFVDLVTGWPEGKYTPTEAIEGLRSLHEAHPNSVFAPLILAELDGNYAIILHEYEKARAVQKELIEHYPWSVHGKYILDGLLHRMSSDSERAEYLKKLQTASKGSLMQKMIEKKLREVTAKQFQKQR